jgi:zinc D-Ala-D-Ala carboxypeptidase
MVRPPWPGAQVGGEAADAILVDNISRVMARIDTIRSQVGMPADRGRFQAVLDSQMTIGSTDVVAMGSVRPVTSVPVAVPHGGVMSASELQAYLSQNGVEDRNGRLDQSELSPISGGWGERNYALLPPAASAYEQMRAAAAAEGVELQVIDAYRSWEVQARAYEDYLAGRKKEHVVAPGTSQHGNGLAVDFTDGAIIGRDDHEWKWLQDNARRFGWYPISNETWHWEFRGVGA